MLQYKLPTKPETYNTLQQGSQGNACQIDQTISYHPISYTINLH